MGDMSVHAFALASHTKTKGKKMNAKKAKVKVSKKIGKAVKKVAKKCGRAAKCIALLVAIAAMAGCGSYPAAYSVTQNNEFEGCTFNFGSTNTATNVPPVEMFTLAQNLENGGSQTADQKTTTDVSPEVAVGVGGSSAGVGQGGGSSSGTFQKIGAAAGAVAPLLTNCTSSAENSPTASSGASSAENCPDGRCSEAPEDCEECRVK